MNESEETTQTETNDQETSHRRRLHPAAIAGIVLVAIALLFLLIWYFTGSRGSAGQPVPAPRSQVNTAPAEAMTGQVITLTPEQIQAAGITIEAVGEQLSTGSTETSATGAVEQNAYKETPVISFIGGVVRRMHVELGQNVLKGQTVAVIFSDEFAAAQSRYLALQTEAQTARQNYERTVKLVKISPVSNAELDQALAALKTATAELEEHHKHHERAAKLVAIGAASREEFEQATTKLKTAQANVVEAKNRYDRAVQVAQINPVSRSEFEQAAVKLQTAESDLATARERLLLLGVSTQRVNALRSPAQISSDMVLTAPVSGTVTKRDVNQGELIEANKPLLTVADLSTVWVIAQVYERDIAGLAVGSGATITSDAFPERVFRGHITYIDPQLDEATRTAKVRIEVANGDRVLKLGMYVRVALGQSGGSERTVPVVPSSAVQTMDDRQIVFVATNDPNTFELRPVRLGRPTDGKHEVLEGLTVGDRVVTNGSFMLRAEAAKSRVSSEHQH